jgi:hypothetical protein
MLEHLDRELLLLRMTGSFGAPKTGTIHRYVEGCIKKYCVGLSREVLDTSYGFPVFRQMKHQL